MTFLFLGKEQWVHYTRPPSLFFTADRGAHDGLLLLIATVAALTLLCGVVAGSIVREYVLIIRLREAEKAARTSRLAGGHRSANLPDFAVEDGTPTRSIEERIRDRHGTYENVALRFTLVWDTTDDLDLHITSPCGDTVWYGSRTSSDGGVLDIDANAGVDSPEPVENVVWPGNAAPEGIYLIKVHMFNNRNNGVTAKYLLEIASRYGIRRVQNQLGRTGSCHNYRFRG